LAGICDNIIIPHLIHDEDGDHHVDNEEVKAEDNCQNDADLVCVNFLFWSEWVDSVIDDLVVAINFPYYCCQFFSFDDLAVVCYVHPAFFLTRGETELLNTQSVLQLSFKQFGMILIIYQKSNHSLVILTARDGDRFSNWRKSYLDQYLNSFLDHWILENS